MINASPDHRNIIPRWLPFRDAASQQLIIESTPHSWKPDAKTLSQFEYLKHEWQNEHSPGIASDLIGSAVVLERWNDTTAQAAAESLLTVSGSGWAIPRSMAAWILGSRSVSSLRGLPREQISRIRQTVRDYPRDALAWLDLGYFYTLLGMLDKAERCISVAATLGGRNTFIARSVARFFIHTGDLEQGLYHLERFKARFDPLLLAPAASISDILGRSPRDHKAALAMIADSSRSPASRSELAAVIATRELQGGRSKPAKKLIRQALDHPSENTLAQAIWLAPKLNLDPEETRIAVPNQHEADARHFQAMNMFDQAIEASKKWQRFQPFSSSPALFGSFIASVFSEDHKSALELVELALPSSSDDYVLHNNRAFSLAQLGRLDDADEACSRAGQLAIEDEECAVVTATAGLIAYRRGQLDEARRRYRDAIKSFRTLSNPRLATLGLYFWAKEELRLEKGIIQNESELVKAIESLREDKEEWKELQHRLFAAATDTETDASIKSL